jgi:hypothetical protein
VSEVAVQDQWSVSLELRDPSLTYGRFEEICTFLGVVNTEVRFAMGDVIVLGPEHFGEEAYQAIERLQLSEEARREYARVSLQVPVSLRRKDVSWSHHRAVAAVKGYKEKKEILRKAAELGLSHHALREELRNGAEPRASSICRCCGREY